MKGRNAVNAELICVGTELLLGDVLNTNSKYIASKLAEIGIDVYYHVVVGDNPERLKNTVKIAAERSGIVIITGGLGPTEDDITMQIACEVTGKKRVMLDEIVSQIRAYYDRIGRVPTENNFRQAMLPEDSEIFPNDLGTAPGCAIEYNDSTVMLLPGPPKEMKHMFDKYVYPYLLRFSNSVLRSHYIQVYGLGESAVDEIMGDCIMSADPTVSPYAKDGEMYLRVSAKAVSVDKANESCKKMIDVARERLGGYIYGIDSDGLNFRAVELLKQRGKTVATAESCTGGMIGEMLTQVPGVSQVYSMGVVTYSNDAKSQLLGVPNETISRYGAVSPQTAAAMARGIRQKANSDIGISVSGIAGPDSDGTDKPVGLVYVSISTAEGERVAECHFGGFRERQYIRHNSALEAFNLIRMYLDDYEFFVKYKKFINFD